MQLTYLRASYPAIRTVSCVHLKQELPKGKWCLAWLAEVKRPVPPLTLATLKADWPCIWCISAAAMLLITFSFLLCPHLEIISV